MSADDMHWVSPRKVLERVAGAIPEDCRGNIVVICLLSPRVQAVRVGEEVVESLRGARWTPRSTDGRPPAGNEATADGDLPFVRLHPPGETEWFLELLAPPDPASSERRQVIRVVTSYGHFGLPAFRYLRVVERSPVPTRFGVAVARPAMLALANLLEHPRIGPELMSGQIGGRDIKRTNKDLGRVLAIARVSGDATVEEWPALWVAVLRETFPAEWRTLAELAGGGIRQILREESEPDLEEARHTCEHGLLASRPPTLDQLRVTGLRLIQDAIEPLEEAARPSR